mmetsp:Transcript_21712/g.34956  ORF Transcript_21712/g.34956 Transcript_21712/m.34956 type:complete len:86 (+) Transcript_21712:18-275(+)
MFPVSNIFLFLSIFLYNYGEVSGRAALSCDASAFCFQSMTERSIDTDVPMVKLYALLLITNPNRSKSMQIKLHLCDWRNLQMLGI